ncbi:hypothetical protein [Nonomuraea sp. NPDC050310]|uniref:hypothetical protein n=1 Tax=Nonomuraea sp. NPDC050310 TaxID=3154935 RepID=UPI0033F6C04D
MRLWTVQHRAVLAELAGGLTGRWERVIPTWLPAYAEMVAEMARRGVDCAGNAPIWAWPGPDDRGEQVQLTAELLVCPRTPEEYEQYVILDLRVPEPLVVLSSYGRWNDFLEAQFAGRPDAMDWTIDPGERKRSFTAGVQACLPRLDPAWVLGSRVWTAA